MKQILFLFLILSMQVKAQITSDSLLGKWRPCYTSSDKKMILVKQCGQCEIGRKDYSADFTNYYFNKENKLVIHHLANELLPPPINWKLDGKYLIMGDEKYLIKEYTSCKLTLKKVKK